MKNITKIALLMLSLIPASVYASPFLYTLEFHNGSLDKVRNVVIVLTDSHGATVNAQPSSSMVFPKSGFSMHYINDSDELYVKALTYLAKGVSYTCNFEAAAGSTALKADPNLDEEGVTPIHNSGISTTFNLNDGSGNQYHGTVKTNNADSASVYCTAG